MNQALFYPVLPGVLTIKECGQYMMLKELKAARKGRVILLALALSVLGAGCDNNGRPIEEMGLDKLAKGISTEAEVRGAMGQPDTVWEEEDGARTLEYPKGPMGHKTWVFEIGKDGKMKDYTQVLTEEHFAQVMPGMSRDKVRHMLGRPRSVVQFRLKREEVWDWLYRDRTQTPRLFNVHFDIESGKVTSTSSSEAPSQAS
jgi:outer membrane protein assembly factor BamE (lipoprotein component of BamABCDE complex)